MWFGKKSLGIDISDYSIEIVSLGGSFDSPKLETLARDVLQEGICEKGEIKRSEDLKGKIQKLLENPDFGKIGTNKIVFSLPEEQVFIRNFFLPEEISPKEAEEYAAFQAKESFPFPAEAIYFDSRIKEREVFLAASPKKIIQEYFKVFQELRLRPVAFEPSPLSLARALSAGDNSSCLIADIGDFITSFCVFEKKALKMSFSFPLAGRALTKAISEKLALPGETAERFKEKAGLNPKLKQGKIFLVLQKELQEIIKETKRISDYFFNKTGKSVEKIILAGGSAALPGIVDYLAQNLETKVEVGDPWQKINIDILKKKEYLKEAMKVNPLLYSSAIGAALRGLEKNPRGAGVNLLTKN